MFHRESWLADRSESGLGCPPMRTPFAFAAGAILLSVACKEQPKPAGLVVDASAMAPAVDAGPAQVDIMQCAGCGTAGAPAWQFVGIYRDDKCTDPLAQADVSACAMVPAVGATNVLWVEDQGTRKAGENVQATVGEQIAPEAARFYKSGAKCVRANEVATDVAPLGCAGQRVCRDGNGTLACGTSCRTFANGCPDLEETRVYATIVDAAKPAAAGGNANVARLKQCCAAIAAQGKAMGASPEGAMLVSAGAQCNAIAAQAVTGNAPELATFKQLLAGRNVPAVCAGL